jgi:hypothetical protein
MLQPTLSSLSVVLAALVDVAVLLPNACFSAPTACSISGLVPAGEVWGVSITELATRLWQDG